MPKRQALNQLTQENWDEQEESENPGTFKKLPEDNLSSRVIKQGSTMQPSSPFSLFKGFGVKGETRMSENGNVNSSQHGNGNILIKSKDTAEQQNNTRRDVEYYRLLKCLNESLVNWVTQHLTKNPLCDFTPVFTDYKRHLEDLEKRFPISDNDSSVAKDNLKTNTSTASLPHSTKSFTSSVSTERSGIFGSTSKAASENNTVHSSDTNVFGNIPPKESTLSAQNISSDSPLLSVSKSVVAASNTAIAATGFQFGNITNSSSKPSTNTSSNCGKAETNIFTIPAVSTTTETKPFTFSPSVAQSNERKEDLADETEESAEPPKNDFVPVVEKDAFYSKRCKLFYNKDGNYIEKGIGTLHLKPYDEKTQLVVRADTSLGNILLNIELKSSLPVKRVGKNNVLIVCIPNPPIDPNKQKDSKAVPILIRVKTDDDANELLKQIEESKSS